MGQAPQGAGFSPQRFTTPRGRVAQEAPMIEAGAVVIARYFRARAKTRGGILRPRGRYGPHVWALRVSRGQIGIKGPGAGGAAGFRFQLFRAAAGRVR